MSNTTSVRACADHATCERNKKTAFRSEQLCLTCERSPATHFVADANTSAYMLRCDECFVSGHGCQHAEPNVCPECFDAITLDLHGAETRLLDTVEQLQKALDVARTVGGAALISLGETPDEKNGHIARLQREKETAIEARDELRATLRESLDREHNLQQKLSELRAESRR